MVIKLYISGISGNKEVKKKQQRVQMILDSKQIIYEAIDITEPGREKDKEFMQQNGKVRESLGKYPLPPQIFNDDDFCGDYEDFDMANEVDELEKFLHIETKDSSENSVKPNEEMQSIKSQKSSNSMCNPYDYHSVNGLQEQIIVNNELMEESKEPEETTKSEVNSESDTALSSQLPSETGLKTEALSENVPGPEQEEDVSTRHEEENIEEKPERENNQQEVETEEEENTKKEEEVEEENGKEEETEKAEEEKEEEEGSEKEERESEGGNESGRESPQSEKSQDD